MAKEALSGLWAKGLLADKTRGRQHHGTGPLEGLQVLFEDLAQVTAAFTRSKAVAARGRATEQPAQCPTCPLPNRPREYRDLHHRCSPQKARRHSLNPDSN